MRGQGHVDAGRGRSGARARGRRSSEGGFALLVAVLVTFAVLLGLASAVSMAVVLAKDARQILDNTEALATAEGVTESAQKAMLTRVANFETPDLSGYVSLSGQSHPFVITPIGSAFTQTDSDGIYKSIQHYQISSSADTREGHAAVDRVVDLTLTPLFQFMIFYSDDLEILPGPNMNLGGRVHSNGDIYVGCGSTLRVDSEYFRCTGDILRKRKNDGSESTGTVSIKVTGAPTYEVMDNGHDSEFPDWTTFALDTWKGTVQDGSHGVREIAIPEIKTIKAFQPDGTKGFYHDRADLVIVDDKAYDRAGNVLSLPVGTIVEKTMYDAREGKSVKVTDVNVGLLNSSGYFPPNGLVYAYRTDASRSQPNGIRLSNGSQVLRPLTFVSEDPVYVRGDFNTANKKGVAVICDAINLLSNAWNDSKTATSGLPNASNTTYNLAVVTGNVPTPDGGGDYSGGFENLPRFHENWTGKTATIRGSFIKIFESEIATKPWVYGGNVYQAPNRDWTYDTALNDMANLPPFTPSAVYFQRVLWDDRLTTPIE